MEKAKLIVRETKKKSIAVDIHFTESDKKMPFPLLKLNDTSMNGAEVEVERDKGRILSIKAGDRFLFSSSPPEAGSYRKEVNTSQIPSQTGKRETPKQEKQFTGSKAGNKHVEHVHNPAHAPYNFVPLNDRVVSVKDKVPDFDTYHNDRYTGYIELDIETKTPLYIRGTLSKEEDSAGKECKDISRFFSPGNKIRIPGSSLRGLVRNIVEITAFGKFGFFDDKRLYFRGLADQSNLRREYQDRMSSYDRKQKKAMYKASAGVLIKRGFDYFIKPSDSYSQILKKDARQKVESAGKKYGEFNFYKLKEGYCIVSGNMKNKKRDWLIEFPKANTVEIPISDEDVRNYNDDITRGDRVPNVIKLSGKGEVPCFYVRWKDAKGKDRISFGHTGMFRLAYEKTIGEHIPGELQDENKIDFAEAIFGNETTFSGRVFFEDAFLKENREDVLMGESNPKILSSPKPTTFQHYLLQTVDNNKEVNHYNTTASIRGYKLYWHKSGNNWKEDEKQVKQHTTQYTVIRPVKSGISFKGRLRFENLSDVELGSLLLALDLPEGLCHKMGMGKPLGLGSVKISPSLYLSDRKKRYESFFAEFESQKSGRVTEFKKTFEKYILGQLGQSDRENLWEVDRMRDLMKILDFEFGVKLEKENRYMNITPYNEFKTRPVLPGPGGV